MSEETKIRISSEQARTLKALLSDPDRLKAFKSWRQRLTYQAVSNGEVLNLSPEAWAECTRLLQDTGWFTLEEQRLTPNDAGNDFLYGAAEYQLASEEKKDGYSQIESVLEQLNRGPAVDIGCGIGLLLILLARCGFGPLYGYDLTTTQLKIAAALLAPFAVDVSLFQKDATLLAEIDDESLAVAVARGSLHYFYQDQLAAAIQRVLRPGGYLLSESIGPSFYWSRITSRDFSQNSLRRRIAYCRTVVRTGIYLTTGQQPLLGAKAPEIAWSKGAIRRFARLSGLELVDDRPAFTLHGRLVLFRKP